MELPQHCLDPSCLNWEEVDSWIDVAGQMPWQMEALMEVAETGLAQVEEIPGERWSTNFTWELEGRRGGIR